MQPRIDYRKHAPEAVKSVLGLEKYIAGSGLDEKLIHLVKMRASQINGCAYCLDMHSIDARAAGETEPRLYTLDAWRETPFFTDRERAALAWAEALTLISETHAPDNVYEELQKYFTEKEIVDLTWALCAINLWNRVAISFRAVPGHYKPAKAAATSSSS
jgi:AhpD family alkylhydroperoxidase